MSVWQTGQPPHDTLVEVDGLKGIYVAKAIHGSDGVRPHWASEDGSQLWPPDQFRKWREIGA